MRLSSFARALAWPTAFVALLISTPLGQNASALSSRGAPGRLSVQGTAFVMAGNPATADLYKIDLSTLTSTRLTKGAGISSVTAGGGRVVVTAGFGSLLEQYANGHLEPIPGLGETPGFTPDVSKDGNQVAFVQTGQRGDALSFSVLLYDIPSQTLSTLYTSATPLELTAFGPRGVLVVDKGDGADQRILRILPSRKQLGPTPGALILKWGRGPYLAWAGGHAADAAFLLDPSTGATVTVPGWIPLCWSPDGSKLLLNSRRDLGVLELPDTNMVVDLGPQPVGPLWACGWTS